MKLLKTSIAAVISLAVIGFAAAPASAAGTSPSQVGSESSTADELLDAMNASDIPRTVTHQNGVTLTTFHSTTGSKPMDLTFGSPDDMHADLGGGWDNKGPYILLNQFDQDAIISGGGFALGLALCGAFPPACGYTTAVITAATLWLSYNGGKCPGNQELMLPLAGVESAIPPFTGYQIHCVA